MELSKDTLMEICKEVAFSNDLNSEDVPEIDLYIDQITTLFENKLGHTKRHEEDKLLTKTMVNNYSKEDILLPIHGKKYSKEHILQLAMIYVMKQCLSLQDIKRTMYFPEKEIPENRSFEPIYNEYLQLRKQDADVFMKFFADILERLELDNQNELLPLLLYLCSLSGVIRRVAEAIIDTCYEVEPEKQGKEKKS